MHLLTQKGKFQSLSKELLPTHHTPYSHTQREEEREREKERGEKKGERGEERERKGSNLLFEGPQERGASLVGQL